MCFHIFFTEGNFDIDAGDGGGGGGPFRTVKSQTITKTYFVRELFTLLGHFSKHVNKYLQNIFIYTEHDNESDKRIKNTNVSYKTHQQYTTTFPKITNNRKTKSKLLKQSNISKKASSYFIIYEISIIHIIYIYI